MRYCLLMSAGSVNARRLQDALRATGITAQIIRPPSQLTVNGCGYAVRVSENDRIRAVRAIAENGLPLRRVYCGSDSDYREMII